MVSISPGDVIRFMSPFARPEPKIKRSVIIAEVEGVYLTAFFNSEINDNIHFSEETRDFLLPFAAEGRPYLDHFSFLDCCNPVEHPKELIIDALKTDFEKCWLGSLTKTDREVAIEAVYKSPALVSKVRKKYFGQ